MQDDPNGEMSFHDMEETKRRLANQAAPEIGGGPELFLDDAGNVPTPSQATFTRQSTPDLDYIQLRRVAKVVQRHWITVLLLLIVLPTAMYVYDEVLNQDYVPKEMRGFGAQRTYESTVVFERVPAAVAVEKKVTEYDPAEVANLAQLISRMNFLPTLEQMLDNAEATKDLPPDFKRELQSFAAMSEDKRKHLVQIKLRSDVENEWRATVRGPLKSLLKPIASQIVPALNKHFRELRETHLMDLLKDNNAFRDTNLRRLAEANVELSRLNDRMRTEEPGAFIGSEKLDLLSSEIFRMQMEREDLEIRLRHFKRRVNYEEMCKDLRITDDSEITMVFIEGNPLRQEWSKLELELTKMRTRYKDIHPAIQMLLNDIEAIKTSIREENQVNQKDELFPLPTVRQVESLKTVMDLKDRLELNRLRLEEVRAKLGRAQDEKQRWEDRQKEAAASARGPNDSLLRRRNELREEVRFLEAKALATARQITELEMVQNEVGKESDFNLLVAASSSIQVSPNVKLDLMVGAIIGLLLGVGLAFLLESMDNYLHTPSDVYYYLRMNYLGVIPFWSEKESMIIAPEHPDSHIGEVFAHLCNNIRYGRAGHPEKRLLIASATPGEGKSIISANVATRYALEGHSVVLIDADMRRPRGHKLIDIFESGQTVQCGLSNYLNGEAEFHDVAYGTSIPGLTLIPAGGRVRNAAKLLGSPKMQVLLEEAERNFDIVIVDSAAVLPVVDATILAPMARGVLIVVSAGEVEIGAVRMALYRLKHVGAPFVGVVLNKVRERSTSYYYYGYRYRGGYYYSPYSRTYGDWDEPEEDRT